MDRVHWALSSQKRLIMNFLLLRWKGVNELMYDINHINMSKAQQNRSKNILQHTFPFLSSAFPKVIC